MTQKDFTRKSFLVALLVIMLGLYGVVTVFAAPPNPGGYTPAETLDPECMPGHSVANGDPFDCFVTAGGGSGWSLIGDAGTDGGVTNFIGTTDAVDFIIKVEDNEIARFGQISNVALGFDTLASGDRSTAFGSETVASGFRATAFGSATVSSADVSTAWGSLTTASGNHATSFGLSTTASGDQSTAFGSGTVSSGARSTALGNNTTASGENSLATGEEANASGYASSAFGRRTNAYSIAESAFGSFNTPYVPIGPSSFDGADRLFVVGNGDPFTGDEHNAYTLWKDGSFAYNDDNFANDDPGTEQNMFYFNYGNHDGEGSVQTKKAIRLGSSWNNEWDIDSVNVGDKSIVLGFSIPGDLWNVSVASGSHAIALGACSVASGNFSFVGTGCNTASGLHSQALGTANIASGIMASVLAGNSSEASGDLSLAMGSGIHARSSYESVLGYNNTTYTPNSTNATDMNIDDPLLEDRLFSIGNGFNAGPTGSDAFTILKDGRTGIAIDNFEQSLNASIFQVGNGATTVIGYVDNGTGNWIAVSDERKKDNIRNLGYGLDTVNELSPKAYVMKSNGQESIGFLAQDVLSIIPEAVFGNEEQGYGMAYQVITPVLVNAIQELDLKFSTIEALSGVDTESFFERITTLVRDTIADMTEIVVQLVKADRIETQELCVDGECFTGDDIRALKGMIDTDDVDDVEAESLDTSLALTEEEIPDEDQDEDVVDGVETELQDDPAQEAGGDEGVVEDEDEDLSIAQEPVVIEEAPVIVEEAEEVLE
jgi:hypothetical protein